MRKGNYSQSLPFLYLPFEWLKFRGFEIASCFHSQVSSLIENMSRLPKCLELYAEKRFAYLDRFAPR